MGGLSIPESLICACCAQELQTDAKYCPSCGKPVISLEDRAKNYLGNLIKDVSMWHVAILGMAALILIGVITNHILIDLGLFTPASYGLLLLVLTGGWIFLGWRWEKKTNTNVLYCC
jgi:hypothetical protein